PGHDSITFALSGSGVQTIQLPSGALDVNYVMSLAPEATLELLGNVTFLVGVGTTPALTVNSGTAVVQNMIFTTNGNAPTILVKGGNLTLRSDYVQESTAYAQHAVSIIGGTLDFGTPGDPGGNVFDVRSEGDVGISPPALANAGNSLFQNGAPTGSMVFS